MQIAHAARALRALTTREMIKFVQQRGRLLSALVRPLMWLAVFAAGFYNVFGVSHDQRAAPRARWVLLGGKLVAGTALSVITCHVVRAVCMLFDVSFDWS